MRLLTAVQAVLTIGVTMLAEWAFVRATGALQIDTHGAQLPPAMAAQIAGQHHAITVIAIMLGAIVGMIASFSAALFPTARSQTGHFLLIPVPMLAGMALGLSLAPYRVAALASFVVILGAGTWARRFGPRGFVGGMLVFMGDFFGFFLSSAVHLGDLGWIAAEIGIGVAIAIAAQLTLFFPSRRRALRRMQRSFQARARQVGLAALDMVDDADRSDARRQRDGKRMHRLLARLNETALLLDAQLGDPAALPPGISAQSVHRCLFDAELALSNTARFAERIAAVPLDPELRASVRAGLVAVGAQDPRQVRAAADRHLGLLARLPIADDGPERSDYIVLHRFGVSLHAYAAAIAAGRDLLVAGAPGPTGVGDAPFQPATMLFGGWLPGSAMVSAGASMEAGSRRLDRIRLAPHVRVAIQMSVAVALAVILGDQLSGRRFYWAVIAAFVTFMGANNAGEQILKGFNRVLGTVIGVVAGSLLVHAVGTDTDVSIVVILAALFFGLYLMRVSYFFMVIGITVMVSQLYVQLNEFSDALLRLRLEETLIGAGAAVFTVLCVVPLRSGRVANFALRGHLRALSDVITAAAARLRGVPEAGDLRAALRRLDAADQSLSASLAPTRISLPNASDRGRREIVSGAASSRYYARNLVIDAESSLVPPGQAARLDIAARVLTSSLADLVEALADRGQRSQRSYVRSASLFDSVAATLADEPTAPIQLALRDLQLIDAAVAVVAQSIGMDVRALDTQDGELWRSFEHPENAPA